MIYGTSENFNSLITDELVLVDFYADWCGPCKMLSPVLEELINDRAELKIVKVDVDQNEDLAKQYGILTIPTLLLFKNGSLVSTKKGYMPKELLNNWINENKQ